MILRMKSNDFLRLRDAAGIAIEVRSGRVWITEDGSAGDSFLAAGRRYRVRGAGLVLIGTETLVGGEGAEIAVVPAPA